MRELLGINAVALMIIALAHIVIQPPGYPHADVTLAILAVCHVLMLIAYILDHKP